MKNVRKFAEFCDNALAKGYDSIESPEEYDILRFSYKSLPQFELSEINSSKQMSEISSQSYENSNQEC